MFCPKCGDKMKKTSLSFECQDGKMELSQFIAERFVTCFIKKIEKPHSIKFNFTIGGSWFCPGCGRNLKENDGILTCTECKVEMNEFIHQLVELHPHLKK